MLQLPLARLSPVLSRAAVPLCRRCQRPILQHAWGALPYLRNRLAEAHSAMSSTTPSWPAAASRRPLHVVAASRSSAGKGTSRPITKEQQLERVVRELSKQGRLQEVMEFWTSLMNGLTRPNARGMVQATIDLSHPMGINVERLSAGGAGAAIPCLDVFVDTKIKHPLRVTLLRNGSFYEAIGYDAVMLVEVCGLNPMAPVKGLPKAGLPVANLNKEIEALLGAGLEVVMVEQYKGAAARYDRDIAKVVTAASPSYKAPDVDLPGMYMNSQPIVGVSWSARGAQLLVLDVEGRKLRRVEALSEEALLGWVSSTGMAALLIHVNPHSMKSTRKSDGDQLVLFQQRVKELLARHAVLTHSYEHADPVEGFKQTVRLMLPDKGDANFEEEQVPYDAITRTRPLYPGTARQLGLIPTDGMPSLLYAVVPETAPGEVRRMWRQHLMVPPSSQVATCVRQAVTILSNWGQQQEDVALTAGGDAAALMAASSQGFPPLSASISYDKVLAMLPATSDLRKPADDRFLRELRDMLSKLVLVLDSPRADLQQLVGCAWPWVLEQIGGSSATQQELHAACTKALAAIKAVVPEGDFDSSYTPANTSDTSSDDEAAATDEAGAAASKQPAKLKQSLSGKARASGNILEMYRRTPPTTDDQVVEYKQDRMVQPWLEYVNMTRGKVSRRVQDCVIPTEMAAVDSEQAKLLKAVEQMWDLAEQHTRNQEQAGVGGVPKQDHPFLVADANNGPALWMRWPAVLDDKMSFSSRIPDFKFDTATYDHTGQRLGRSNVLARSITCPAVQKATYEYLRKVEDAAAQAEQQLRQLVMELSDLRPLLAAAANLSVALVALYEHVVHAQANSWCIPEVGPPPVGPRPPVLTTWRQQQQGGGSSSSSGSSSAGYDLQDVATSSSSSQGGSSTAVAAGQQPGEQAAAAGASAGNSGSSSSSRGGFQIRGMFPFWLPKGGDVGGVRTVSNDVDLNHSMLLTGPNMAGKSTVLRSIAAVSLLANCGCMVPAEGAVLPWLDAVVLRNFSGDSPKEGRSAFAMEMSDMSYVLRDATAHSLVLVDELGKGTEALSGTGLSGALLEVLDAGGATWVFATHLHLLLKLPLAVTPRARCRMVVEDTPGRGGGGLPTRLVPTWRLAPGECTESLALEVAEDQGIPLDVLQRSRELIQQLPTYSNMMPDLSNMSLGSEAGSSSGSSSESEEQWAGSVMRSAAGEQAPADLVAAARSMLAAVQPMLAGTNGSSSSFLSSTSSPFLPPPPTTISSSSSSSSSSLAGSYGSLAQAQLAAAVEQLAGVLQQYGASADATMTDTSITSSSAGQMAAQHSAQSAPATAAAAAAGGPGPPQPELLLRVQRAVADCIHNHSNGGSGSSGTSGGSKDISLTGAVAANGTRYQPLGTSAAAAVEANGSSVALLASDPDTSSTTGSSFGSAAAPEQYKVYLLGPGQQLAPALHARPAVYVVVRPNEVVDVGMSKGMAANGKRMSRWGTEGRLKEAGRRAGIAREQLAAVVVSCPSADAAADLEGVVSRTLQAEGWPLARPRDAKRRG